MEKAQRALELFKSHSSCAQSVAAAFCDELKMSEHDAMALSSMFGAGICSMRDTCGAVTAALMVLGMHRGLVLPQQKATAYQEGQQLIAAFTQKFGSVNCKTLLEQDKAVYKDTPMDRNEEYYKTRPCARLVVGAAELLEEFLQKTK